MGAWGYILVAYGIAVLTFGGYWWSLTRRIRRRESLLARIGQEAGR